MNIGYSVVNERTGGYTHSEGFADSSGLTDP
jgi:hypothetical protein